VGRGRWVCRLSASGDGTKARPALSSWKLVGAWRPRRKEPVRHPDFAEAVALFPSPGGRGCPEGWVRVRAEREVQVLAQPAEQDPRVDGMSSMVFAQGRVVRRDLLSNSRNGFPDSTRRSSVTRRGFPRKRRQGVHGVGEFLRPTRADLGEEWRVLVNADLLADAQFAIADDGQIDRQADRDV
jgi:hypothetical protein